MYRDEWYVITAGPAAGKTSTLRDLSARGLRTAPEAARLVIDQKVSEGMDADEVREEIEFQDLVETVDRRIEDRLPDYEKVFLDRSLADNIAYRRVFGTDVPNRLYEECTDRYGTVFLLERLEFEDDYARDEDGEQAARIQAELRETYEELGHEVVEIPVMPVNERADAILDHAIP